MLKKLYITLLISMAAFHLALLADDFDFDFDNLDALEHAIDDIPDTVLTQKSKHIDVKALNNDDLQDCVEILTDSSIGVNTIPILRVPLYLKTYPLHQRSVHDLPFFNLWLTCPSDNSVFRLDAFYNQTDRSNFTAGSTNIRDYIALEDENLIQAIEEAEAKIRTTFPDFDLNIPNILSLFSCMTVQERRVGIMLQGMKNTECWQFIAKLPVMYVEHNFFLTDEEISIIQNQNIPGISASPTGQPQGDTKKQLQKHLVRDALQLGDFRFDIAYALHTSPTRQSYLGFECTLPTHFNFKQGLLGRKHERKCLTPDFDVCEIIQLGINGGAEDRQIATDRVSAFFIGALDQLTANVLDPNPYNDGRHVTVGLYTNSCIQLCDWLTIRNKNTLSYVTAAKENRYYILDRNPAKFDRDYEDPDKARENMDFLNQQFIEKFYPHVVPTNVRPGIILQMTTHAQFTWWNWGLAFGGDLWWQSQETITHHECLHGLDFQKGIQPEAFQTKMSALLTYRKEKPHHLWNIYAGIEGTTISSGIGKDFSLVLGFEVDF
ncbi:MAG: hypothetical protein WD068_03625 [Candidatus Babeliales bacterium]